MDNPLVEKAMIGAAGLVIGWGGWVTRRVLKHDEMLARLETKVDMLLQHFGINKETS